jgi:hypothetical protein
MQTYGGVEEYLRTLLTSALDEGEWLISRLSRFSPTKEGKPTTKTKIIISFISSDPKRSGVRANML